MSVKKVVFNVSDETSIDVLFMYDCSDLGGLRLPVRKTHVISNLHKGDTITITVKKGAK